jgi:transcriptional regulator with XRE-family HTH domain
MLTGQVQSGLPPYHSGSQVTPWASAMADPTYRKSLGSRIKSMRKARGLTQKDLAQRMGITFGQLNKYESGLNSPAPDLLVTMADLLAVTLDHLLTGREVGGQPLHNTRLVDRVKIAEQFALEDQETIIRLLDAMIVQHRAKGAVASVDRLTG